MVNLSKTVFVRNSVCFSPGVKPAASCNSVRSGIFVTVLTVLFAILPVSLLADYQGGSYTLSDYYSSAEPPLQPENDIIKGVLDSTLEQVESLAGITLRPGELLMRRKIQSETYGFFKGHLDTSAFNMQPPLFRFNIPHWARLEDILHYRLYREPSDAIGSDETIIYFDNERIYTRSFSLLYYFRNGIWLPLKGTSQMPVGSVVIDSKPAGATLFINGTATGSTTPCRIGGLVGGRYTFELRLPHYQFYQRSVQILPDSTTHASFELIADVDTVFITGNMTYSLLLLPEPPVDYPYLIDDSLEVFNNRVRLPPGTHQITWKSDERFNPVDTLITVPSGKVIYFDYQFKRRYGIVRITPTPADAELCIDRYGCSEGERIEELPAGYYRIYAYRHGFQKVKHDLHVIADTITSLNVDLRQVRDKDGDNYIDSVDHCPDIYGLYNGCPSPRITTMLKILRNDVRGFIDTDSLTFGFSLLGIITKFPLDRHFRNFLSVFSSGQTGGLNNYRGLTILNSFSMFYRGLFASLELGQWSAGIQYQRPDTLYLDSVNVFYFDSLNSIEPHLYIPSTALALGFHYSKSWFNISYGVGYQWEDLVFTAMYNLEDDDLHRITFNNDWWFHQIDLEADFNIGDRFVPSVYFRFKLPFGSTSYVRWISTNAGLQLKIFTHPVSNR